MKRLRKILGRIKFLIKQTIRAIYYLPALPEVISIVSGNALHLHNKSKKTIKCPICSSEDTKFLKMKYVRPRYFAMYDQRDIAKRYYEEGYLPNALRMFGRVFFRRNWRMCNSCGNAHTNFPHTNESLFHFYDKFFNIAPIRNVSERIHKVKTLAAKHFIESSGLKPNSRILDVGAAAGFSCKYFQDSGYDAWGIEPSSERVAFARKSLGLNNFIHDFYSEDSFEENFFDGIITHHVLEHVLDVKEVLKGFKKHVRPGGIVLVQGPSLDEDIRATEWGDHTVAYSTKGMVRLLNENGFEALDTRIIPKDKARIPKEWIIDNDPDYDDFVISGSRVGDMCILVKRNSEK